MLRSKSLKGHETLDHQVSPCHQTCKAKNYPAQCLRYSNQKSSSSRCETLQGERTFASSDVEGIEIDWMAENIKKRNSRPWKPSQSHGLPKIENLKCPSLKLTWVWFKGIRERMCIVGETFSLECQTFLDNFETSPLTISGDDAHFHSGPGLILYSRLARSFIYLFLLGACLAFKECH